MNPYEHFYIKQDGVKVEGPYDLVQMGNLLLEKTITPETTVRVEGSLIWKPFREYPQYAVIQETSTDAAARLDKMEVAAEANAPLIPLPSEKTVDKFAKRGLLLVGVGAAAFVIAFCDETAGTVVVLAGLVIAAFAQCLIFGQVLNEDSFTIGKVTFVPLYDIYYFASNLDNYFSKFFVKYLGLTAAFAAAAAMGELHIRVH